MLLFSLPLTFYVLYNLRETNYDVENVVHVEELEQSQVHGAIPKGHHAEQVETTTQDEKASA
jgi:hypothetical protein